MSRRLETMSLFSHPLAVLHGVVVLAPKNPAEAGAPAVSENLAGIDAQVGMVILFEIVSLLVYGVPDGALVIAIPEATDIHIFGPAVVTAALILHLIIGIAQKLSRHAVKPLHQTGACSKLDLAAIRRILPAIQSAHKPTGGGDHGPPIRDHSARTVEGSQVGRRERKSPELVMATPTAHQFLTSRRLG